MKRIYDPASYGPLADGSNLWRGTAGGVDDAPLTEDTTTEVAVIGAGFTGLNAALRLAQHGAKVTVLEAQRVGWGASGRNGGFCCLGGAKPAKSKMVRRYGAAEAQTYQLAERAAIDHVEGLIDTHSLSVDRHSDGETVLAHRASDVAGLHDDAEAFTATHGLKTTFLPREALAEHGMNSPAFHAALTLPLGFALNPQKYVTGLAEAARTAGVTIHGNTPALKISEQNGKIQITTPGGTLTAGKLIVATNGYSSEDIPNAMRGRYLPVPSAILATRPMTEDEISAQGWTTGQMCYDTRQLLHYFRLMPDRRLLFGMRGATRTDAASMARARATAQADLAAMFPAWAEVETPHFWAGFVNFTASFTPFAGLLPGTQNIYAAFGYHGNGVAMGSYTGACLGDIVAGKTPAGLFPDFFGNSPKRFPLGRFRHRALPLAYRWLHFRDR